MNTDFGVYIKELVKKFSENGINAEEKSLQYGCQLVLTKGADKVILSVYNGKKGIKFVWNGKHKPVKIYWQTEAAQAQTIAC